MNSSGGARPLVRLGRRYGFVAAHRLHAEALSEEENCRVYGKCNNPYGHGHNYVVELVIEGRVDAVTGMVYDLGALDAFVQTEIVGRFDHRNLNALEEFVGVVPTTENLAVCVWEICSLEILANGARLVSVRVEETNNNTIEYRGEGVLTIAAEGEVYGE